MSVGPGLRADTTKCDISAERTTRRVEDSRADPAKAGPAIVVKGASMFAPFIQKPRAKTVARTTKHSALPRLSVHGHDRETERGQTSRSVLETAPGPPGNQPAGATWDFSKVPLFPQRRTDLPERLTPASASQLAAPIQRRLTLGTIDDPLEHEADRLADEAMRMPGPRRGVRAAPPQINRKGAEGEAADELQAEKSDAEMVGAEAPDAVKKELRCPGRPLELPIRSFFEPRFGADFADVSVHHDER